MNPVLIGVILLGIIFGISNSAKGAEIVPDKPKPKEEEKPDESKETVDVDKYIRPVSGAITSQFGDRIHPVTGKKQFHNGIDLHAVMGTEIKSPQAGIVEKIYSNLAGGLQMIIKHDNGFRTGYAHLFSTEAQMGQRVNKGDIIAKSGNSGNTSGPHLHFTMKNPEGTFVNPLDYV